MRSPSTHGFAIVALAGDVALVPLTAHKNSGGQQNERTGPASGGKGAHRPATKTKQKLASQTGPRRGTV
jgi:hypothetical protein